MARFGKSTKTSAEIPTAALPDIIFILLFFFMVATKPKKMEPLVTTQLPTGTEIREIDKERAEIDLYIGFPKNVEQFGIAPMLEIDGKLIRPQQIPQMIHDQISQLPASKRNPSAVFVYITVDKGVNSGLLYDVKEELKNIGVRNIIYSVKREQKI